jgi:hypothetical protein
MKNSTWQELAQHRYNKLSDTAKVLSQTDDMMEANSIDRYYNKQQLAEELFFGRRQKVQEPRSGALRL